MMTTPLSATHRGYLPLMRHLFPEPTLLRNLMLVIGGSLVVALTAKVSLVLPFTPVPITGQTLGVLLVGASLGSRLGVLALLTYLMEGAIGLPVFAAGGGLAYFWGPTLGYLVGYPVAAGLMGFWVERFGADRNSFKTGAAMAACMGVIYLFGASWLGLWFSMVGTFDGVVSVLSQGVFPFLIGDVIKMMLTALLLPGAWKLVQGLEGRNQDLDP